jgi:hypothetical protein
MNIVAIDPSLISTALVVSSGDTFKIYNYCRESKVYGKKGITKWFKSAEEFVEYKFIEYREFQDYSEGELTKLKDYDKITDQIIDDILSNIDVTKETKVGIEGYNFGAQVGDLIDLVTFSTLLRKKLFDKVTKDIWVMSPSTLKLESCKLTYEPIRTEIGKKVVKIKEEYRNKIGIPGGKFTKNDMALAIIENENLNDYWSKHCKFIKDELTSVSTIQKPYEDVNDAYLIYQILNKQHTN